VAFLKKKNSFSFYKDGGNRKRLQKILQKRPLNYFTGRFFKGNSQVRFGRFSFDKKVKSFICFTCRYAWESKLIGNFFFISVWHPPTYTNSLHFSPIKDLRTLLTKLAFFRLHFYFATKICGLGQDLVDKIDENIRCLQNGFKPSAWPRESQQEFPVPVHKAGV